MKKIIIAAVILIICIAIPCAAKEPEMRGVWVSSVYNLDYPSKPGLSAAQLAAEADVIIENAVAWGLNTIFLQVRPSGDALYRSEIFPWSQWLTGAQGQEPDGGFDPLEYFIRRAHGLEIEVHAWINPYRITRTAAETREAAFALLAPGHPARSMEDAVVWGADGCLYFDPGAPQARALIIDGVAEILDNYDIDGIHMDDYFYPSGSFDDTSTFALYGAGFDNIGDFRRACVTQLIQAMGEKIKTRRQYADFGISPFGVWANQSQHPEGSATKGDSSYFSHYADTRLWVQQNLLDYIMPQLYWHIGSAEADFDTLLSWWQQVCDGSNVKLYVGLAAYRLAEADSSSTWFGTDEIGRQLELLQPSAARGMCFFRYGSIAGNPELAEYISQYFMKPVESYLLPYRVTTQTLGKLSFPAPLVAEDYSFDISLGAPAGSIVHAVLDGIAYSLLPSGNGFFAGQALPTAWVGGDSRPLGLMALAVRNGVLSVELEPNGPTAIKTGQPVAISRISSSDTDDGVHRITFYTDQPVVAVAQCKMNLITLTISPCRMAVLFEDEFFESIDYTQGSGSGQYSLILPVITDEYSCKIKWYSDRVVLEIVRE